MYSLDGGADVSANEISSPIVITGLTNTVSYAVQLKAVNSLGESVYSNSLSSMPDIVPSAPVINSIEYSDKQLSVDFSVPTYDGTSVLYYLYSLNGDADVSANEVNSPIVINNLTNTVSYSVQLKAVNAFGESMYSTAVSSMPNIVPLLL